ncbi:uncharacterized protein LOC115581827 [Sparus aurata]|uniref:uncharacterized protein LOC115581827 n=1 Tax=Sparus aurata TaxID=8175 RepID=UPI0011C1651C|nr:uncharacterized protein LOC115581827 [Sparus aurata]
MSVHFSGWEVVDDGASFPGMELAPSQKPQKRGVYTMYHGTSVASARLIIANGFKPSSGGMLGQGVYVSRDMKKASAYPRNATSSDRVIFKLRVRPGRVKRIDTFSHPLQYTWHSHGYDTAWLPPTGGLMCGLEEDCVFDPKRVEVVGIAQAPNNIILKELQQLLAQKSKRCGGRGNGAADVCSLCKRKTQQGSPHIKQPCWDCGKTICILTTKHVCPGKP